jgi:hypothetical protein
LHKAKNKLIQKRQAAELGITGRQARPFAEEAEERGRQAVIHALSSSVLEKEARLEPGQRCPSNAQKDAVPSAPHLRAGAIGSDGRSGYGIALRIDHKPRVSPKLSCAVAMIGNETAKSVTVSAHFRQGRRRKVGYVSNLQTEGTRQRSAWSTENNEHIPL